jgi:hypothetical protein
MTDDATDVTHRIATETSDEGKLVAQAVARGFPAGKAPLKIVTGTQDDEQSELRPEARSDRRSPWRECHLRLRIRR